MNPFKHFFIFIFLLSCNSLLAQDTLHVKNVEAILYSGSGSNQPLIVGLGGSEGGNAWASNHWRKTREEFIARGYAFLAIGYFGCARTPALLDKIAIDEVDQAIVTATKYKHINPKAIGVIGGSRGADLALLLGSYYGHISCVLAMSASHAVFPGNTDNFSSSSWTFAGRELPFIPVSEAAVPFLMKRDLRGAFETMMEDSIAEQRALIPVGKIHGPILLMVGRNDEIIPAVRMAEKMEQTLKKSNFKFGCSVKIYEGGHTEPMNHFDDVFTFLSANLPAKP